MAAFCLMTEITEKNRMEIKYGSKNKTINICKKQTENKQKWSDCIVLKEGERLNWGRLES